MEEEKKQSEASLSESETQGIKVEVLDQTANSENDGYSETATDINNYLASFNKEIQICPDNAQNQDNSGGEVTTENSDGAYFITETGECFYQAESVDGQNTQVVTVLPAVTNKDGTINIAANSALSNQTKIENVDIPDDDTDTAANQDKIVSRLPEGGHLLLSNESFRAVTIVPSETSGAVSYVLIVQNPDDDPKHDKEDGEAEGDVDGDEDIDDQDLTVYDFDDGEDHGNSHMDSGDEDDKTKVMKIIARKSQTVSKPHMCNYCNYTSPKRYLLARHMKSHSQERPHKCSVCDRGFKTLASLQNHVNTHTGTKPHHCKHCDSAFTTSGELVRHVRYRHTHEKPHKCSMCDYASVELSKMRNHMRCHTGERPYQCPHCTYASPDTFKLKRHLRIHTGERPYECDICQARFTQSNSLKAHRMIHTVENKPVFPCEYCPTTCGRKTDLRIHVQKLHTSDKIFHCRRCNKEFPDRYSFKMHSKSHEGEKCWKCDLCPYASVSSRHLESHMLVHTDEKPFHCELCDQRFRQKQLLKRHQNLYHNPGYIPPIPREKTHECPECKKSFRHKGNLIRHLSVHDPDSVSVQQTVALKVGRKKKIRSMVNSQRMLLPSDTEEEETDPLSITKQDTTESIVTMGSEDGHQYVLLEVIQLHDSDGQGQTVTVVSDKTFEQELEQNANDSRLDEPVTIKIEDKMADNTATESSSDLKGVQKVEEPICDVDNCFGFGDSDEEEMESETIT